jgi:asparagine synthase (glutamine-hydrolysing)
MCSIAGMIDFNRDLRAVDMGQMGKVMTYRGPDQKGAYIARDAALFHHRLCVIDRENGRQPMTATCGSETYTIVYNGELYNTAQLRSELKDAGHTFLGHSDTEVLLKAYIQWGSACVERFNGIFAFAIYETAARRLFIARDRMGVKPFFYTIRQGALLFASEIKGLLAHPWVQPQADRTSVWEIILTGPGRTPGCGVFKDIYELPPAYLGYFDETGLHTQRYWTLQPHTHRDNLENTIGTVRELVTDAITRQLVSDVPIGTFLSGGLDSGLICSIANTHLRRQGKRLKTFSVDYKDNQKYFQAGKFQPTSDSDYIFPLRDWLDCDHTLVTLDSLELADALYEAVEARDLPGMSDVDSSLLLFCKKIKEQVTVALSGECADEIFGGYPWYRDEKIRMTQGFPWAQSIQYRAAFLQPDYAQGLDATAYVMEKYNATLADTQTLPEDSPLEQRMRQMMRLNTDWFMQTLLDRKDRMSMYSALEVRVPFCDHRIAEYLYSVPWEMKDYNHFEKGLLRKAMEGYLPENILWRKKSPYPKTHNPSYMRLVSQRLQALLDGGTAPLFQLVRPQALTELLQDNKSQPWYGQLMTTPQTIAYMLQVNYWLEHYHVEFV